jgi:hypothetical protein
VRAPLHGYQLVFSFDEEFVQHPSASMAAPNPPESAEKEDLEPWQKRSSWSEAREPGCDR